VVIAVKALKNPYHSHIRKFKPDSSARFLKIASTASDNERPPDFGGLVF
jgi:hypothetical protein